MTYPKDFRPIVHIVDDWFTNRKLGMLYEARVGKGKLLVCGATCKTIWITPGGSQSGKAFGIYGIRIVQPVAGVKNRRRIIH